MSVKFFVVDRRAPRAGFSLMELLVVITIMALVAVVALPKLSDVLDRSRSGSQTYSLADAARSIETFNAMNRKYPEGWDTLLTSAGTGQPSSLASSIINPALSTLLTTTGLTDAQITALNNAGISHGFAHVATTNGSGTLLYLPSDTGRERHHFAIGASGHDGTGNFNTAAILNTSTTTGLNFALANFHAIQNTDASADAVNIGKNIYVVFGLGPRCTAVQSIMEEAPIIDAATPTKYYARALAVFSVPVTPSYNSSGVIIDRAKMVGMIGPDGRGKMDSYNQYNNVTVPH